MSAMQSQPSKVSRYDGNDTLVKKIIDHFDEAEDAVVVKYIPGEFDYASELSLAATLSNEPMGGLAILVEDINSLEGYRIYVGSIKEGAENVQKAMQGEIIYTIPGQGLEDRRIMSSARKRFGKYFTLGDIGPNNGVYVVFGKDYQRLNKGIEDVLKQEKLQHSKN